MSLEIVTFPCLDTNIGILLRETETGNVAAIDAPDADTIDAELKKRNWTLNHILITHSHSDHVQGVPALIKRHSCRVIAPAKAQELLKQADLWVGEGDKIRIGNLRAAVLATPGHCQDHLSYWFESIETLFAGDCLFAMGCGRVFGGNYRAMWASLQRLAGLPEATRVYFGHDYALANGRFALAAEPENAALQARVAVAETVRAVGRMFISSTIGDEKQTNPFLRTSLPQIAQKVDLENGDPVAVFKALRDWKDRF